MKEQSKVIRLKALTRPARMNDGQYALYQEMRKTSEQMFEALLMREREKWLKLSLRMRDLNRMAHDQMFL